MSHFTQSGLENVAACAVMISLTGSVLLARFAVRASQRQMPFGADWLCVLSVLPFYVYCGLILQFILTISVDGSFDAEITHGVEQLVSILRLSYSLEIIFGVVITTVKLSILAFYWKIFAANNGNKKNQRVIQVAAVGCIAWFIIVTFIIIFQCKPTHAYWDDFAAATYCLDTSKILLGYEITNLTLDVFILCIPFPIVWQLSMPPSKKAGLMCIFLLGAFVCVASIFRLTAIWNPPNPVDFSRAFLWSTIQMGLAIICACLPTLAPVLPYIVMPFSYLRILTLSIWSRSSNRTNAPPMLGDEQRKTSEEYELTHSQWQGQPQHVGHQGWA